MAQSSALMWPASSSSSNGSAFPSPARCSRSRPSPRGTAIITSHSISRPLLALLHLGDSLFPIGGFGYSDGLEAATAAGLVPAPGQLQAGRGGLVGEGLA